jgi:opacity protein-like surface antigen
MTTGLRHGVFTAIAMIALVVIPLDLARAETRLGIKGGASFASYDLEGQFSDVEIGNREGFAAGLELEYSLQPWLWLFVEPMYVQKGATVDFSGAFDFADNTQKYDYIVVPVGLKGITELGPVRPFGRVGLGLGFAVNSETEFESEQSVVQSTELEDPDVTIELGLGAEIPANERVAFTVEGRYSLGVASISPEYSDDLRTRTVLVLGGVSFRL